MAGSPAQASLRAAPQPSASSFSLRSPARMAPGSLRRRVRRHDHRAVGGVVDRLVLIGPADAVVLVARRAEHLEDEAAARGTAAGRVDLEPVAGVSGIGLGG